MPSSPGHGANAIAQKSRARRPDSNSCRSRSRTVESAQAFVGHRIAGLAVAFQEVFLRDRSRGAFFTDEGNTPFGFGGELECEGPENGLAGEYECELEEAGEDGEVPSVWLLSARFNMDIGNTGASIFVAGENLLDDLYISDREDGMKPGLGRTIWTGFKYKF